MKVNIPLAVATLLLTLPSVVTLQARTSAVETDSAQRAALAVTSEPEVIVNGSPCLFRVKSRRAVRSLSGEWHGRSVFFNFNERDGAWYGFAGVGVDAVAGRSRLTLEVTTASGGWFSYAHPVRIEPAHYSTPALGVASQYTEPDAEALTRIEEEQELKKEAFARITSHRLWSGNFEAPVYSRTTGEFGTRRTFNHKVQSVHQGLDFRADIGTPVGAMNSGVVILAREMFYEGGFVVIDHG